MNTGIHPGICQTLATLRMLLVILCAGASQATDLEASASDFVEVSSGRLVLKNSGEPYYFSSTNQYYLFYKPLTMVDEVFADANAMGINVLRTWGFCDGMYKEGISFQPEPGVYHESGFARMDYLIKKARDMNMRLIIVLTNNWSDFGGIPAYVDWSLTAASHDDFYTDATCKSLYRNYVAHFLNRVNTLTGVAYKDDPTILMWELANEPRCPSDTTANTLQAWIDEMAGFIKSIDSDHLVSTGEEGFYAEGGSDWRYNGSQGTDFIRHNSSPHVDICSFHLLYDDMGFTELAAMQWIQRHMDDARFVIGKPVYCGEIGKEVARSAPDAGQRMTTRNRLYADWYDAFLEGAVAGGGFWLLSADSYPDYDDYTVYYPQDAETCSIVRGFSNILAAWRERPSQIDWLKAQQDLHNTGLVDSYERDGTDRAYTYDQALAVIALTEAGERGRARKLLNAMRDLQDSSGRWYQGYDASTGDLAGSDCNRYPTGDIAWMVMAVNFYERRSGDRGYAAVATKALGWLDTLRNTDSGSEKYGSLRLCDGIACQYPNAVSTENNFDAYSAYFWRGELSGSAEYTEKAGLIRDYLIREMWAPSPSSNGPYHDVNIFWQGFGDFAYCTDCQSWGVLALGPAGPNGEEFARSLEWLYDNPYGSTRNQQDYSAAVQAVDGFKSCTGEPNDYVWVEGLEGAAAAFYSTADDNRGSHFHNQTAKVVSPNGGVVYSFSDARPQSERWVENWRYNSVATTAWYYFNEVGLNPFVPPVGQACVPHDWNDDGIVSIIGDVPPFVQCVYFSDCPAGVDSIAVGDCNYDGITSIVGDVPCFVDCVYFQKGCPE
jgi:hypothetical protein